MITSNSPPSTEEQEEERRLRANRQYFEDGCACIFYGKLAKAESTVSDSAAVERYERECTCTRNYV